MMMLNISLRKKARQFSRLVRSSALQPRTGVPQDPVLVAANEVGITFIGHSSFLIQIGGMNVTIDPNYAKWLIVLKRLRRPGLLLRDLPVIDAVLISHAHMDHLHRPSLRRIARLSRRASGAAPVIVVPQHCSDLVADLGFSEIKEMEWWSSFDLHSGDRAISITQVPARHWGARMINDHHRGFGGYVLRDPNNMHGVYHAGDTAYFDGFAEIGERLQPDIALLPIGAYHPETYRNVHASPEDALRGFAEMHANWFIPMHYGTFRLSQEPVGEPVERLLAGARRMGIADHVLVLEEGSTQVFSAPELIERTAS